MGKRFCAHFGSLDNLSWLASVGFAEAGLVWDWDGSTTAAGTASAIHNAGIPTATFNAFNDGSAAVCQPGAAGGPYAGYFQALASAGWNCIAGEGCGGSVVSTVQNYCTYVNYGGIVGDSQGDMYADPWDHPTGGGKGHWDYIESYDNSDNYVDPSQSIGWSRSAGAGHLGILIGNWMQGVGAQTYINVVDSTGCDTICFWGGYSASSSSIVSLAQQLISHYGATKTGATGGTAGATATAAATTAATKAVIQCPCKHISIAFVGSSASDVSQHIEFKVQITGRAGWVDNNENWIHGKPYTGQLEIWTSNAKKTWSLGKIWPDKNGDFAFSVGSDTAEKRSYSVCFV
jgi:hypothetical protein